MKKKVLLFVALLVVVSSYSQEVFTRINTQSYKTQLTDQPSKFQNFKLNTSRFLEVVSSVRSRNQQKKATVTLKLPNEKGGFEEFYILENSVLGTSLSAKYPSIKSYIGKSVHGNSVVRFSYSPSQGFVGAISNHKNATILIKPVNLKSETYVSFLRSDMDYDANFECETVDQVKKKLRSKKTSQKSNDNYLRKYRVAIATTGEFSNFFLDGSEANDTERKQKVLAAINTSLTRINGIFERDFSITMELVANNDELLFLDSTTDPFTNSFNSELQNTLDAIIGDENYDVGHMFGHENSVYGSAGCIACVCTTGAKGSGFTVHRDPSSDDFNMIASHEFGHQFGGYHVQSSSNCRSSAGLQEVEPGSGSSIMGYAGICSPNVQNIPDDYFNYVDIRDVIQWTRNDSSCAELIATENTNPQVNAGVNYAIPALTAFVLEGKANDVDANNVLSYCWEQNNPEDPRSNDYPNTNWVYGPLYRSKLPVSTPVRYMPQLSDVLSGNLTPTWEVTPSVSRELNFVLTVRDNALLGAKTDSDEMVITVDDSAGPFIVTSQDSSETWYVGDTKTIFWNVANTNIAPINALHVDILLSLDGGYTYPLTIAENVTNIGSADIIVPEIEGSTTTARLMVKASDNIFFAVNQSNFQIQSSNFVLSFEDTTQEICGSSAATYTFLYNTVSGFSEETTFSLNNVPDGVTATFIPDSASENGTIINLEIENTTNFSIGENLFEVNGVSSSSITKKAQLKLNRFENNSVQPSLISPSNAASNIKTNVVLQWENDANAENYTVEVSSENDFSTITDTAIITKNNYAPFNLNFSTTYFWRVKSNNSCGETVFSDVNSFTTECVTPTNAIASNIGLESAKLRWVENGNAASWEVEVVEKGTTAIGAGVVVNDRNYIIENLTPATEYDVYVRSLCDDVNSSEWLTPFSFTTLTDFCNGNHFYDTGGADGNYANDEFSVTVISPNESDVVEVTFLSFDVEFSDRLYVFDGEDSNAPFLGSYTGTTLPPVFRSSFGKKLAFYFLSDGRGISSGWEAEVNCITISCPAPDNLIATNIQSNSIDLDWNTNGDESKWEVEFGERGFDLGTGTKIATNQKNFTLQDLNPSTNYEIYVKAICGENSGEDDSFYSAPILVQTPCGVYDAPYFYDVEQAIFSNDQDCWENNPKIYESGYFWAALESRFYNSSTGPFKAKSGNRYYSSKSYSFSTDAGEEASLNTPEINIDTLDDPVLNFYSYMYGENIGSLHVDIYNNETWSENVFEISGEQQTNATSFWNEHLIDLQEYQGVIKIRFRTLAGGNNNTEIAIDDISVIERPTCPNPTEFSAANITGNSADLNWSVNGDETKWEVEYGNPNYTPGEGTKTIVTSNSYTLTGLQPIGSYDLYVRAICGENPEEDDSRWVGPISIQTPCGTFIAPFTYDLESIPYSGDIYDCWSTLPDNDNGSYYWNTLQTRSFDLETGPLKSKSGRYHFGTSAGGYRIQEGDKAVLLSPFIDISNLITPVLDFHSFMYGQNIGSLHVDIFNNGVWTDDVLVINGEQQDESTDLWEQNIVDLSDFENTIQIRFRAIAPTNNLIQVAIDDINVYEMPTCINPSDFEVANVTYESAELSWQASQEESQWQIEYVKQGYNLGEGTKVTALTNTFTLQGLESETNYDIYLRAVCGDNIGDDDSDWVGPIAIETPCGIFETPYFYDVENQFTNTVDQCWSATTEDQFNYTWRSPYSGYNNGDTGAAKSKSGFRHFAAQATSFTSQGDVTILTTPLINITSLDNPALDFYSFMFGENIGSLHVDVFSDGNWIEDIFVLEGQQQTSPQDLWQQNLVALEDYSEIIQLRFRAISGGAYNCEIDIDDINIVETPTCLNPADFEITNITYDSVDLSWSTSGSENQWQVEYGSVGYIPDNGTKVTATTNPFTLEGLDADTTYDIYIKSVCGDVAGEDDGNWVGPISIETPCGIFEAPYFYDIENQSSGRVDDCWVSTIEDSYYYWRTSAGQNYRTTSGPFQAKSGSKYFVASPNRYDTVDDVAELITPIINVSSLNEPILEFYSFMYGESIGALHVDIRTDGSWVEDLLIINGEQQTNSQDNWDKNTIDLSAYQGNVQVRFRAISGGTYDCQIAIEDISFIEMPTCPTPLNLTTQNITDTTVELSWDVFGEEQKWEIQYGETGFNLGNGTTILADSNPFTITNLNSQTNYDFYLRAVCGENPEDDDSEWISLTAIETLANFCNGDRFYDSGGANGNYSNLENEITVIHPIESTFVEVEFLELQMESCCDRLTVYDGPDINSPLLGSYSGTTLPGKLVSTHESGALTFLFRSDGSVTGSGWEATVNCVTITCPEPTNLEASNITETALTLDWNAGGDEEKWEVEYGVRGFDLGTGTKSLANSNTFEVTNLTSNTNYDFYVRAVCGDNPEDDDSEWISLTSIKTPVNFCNGNKFYDTGGEAGNYSDNEYEITVISPISADYVEVEFLEFDLESCCDRLTVYDGPDINSPLLGSYSGTTLPGKLVSTHESGALTFLFRSDSSVTGRGWEAEVNCVTITCPKPSNLEASNITTSAVTLDWNAGGDEEKWEIEYGIRGFTLGTGTKILANTNTYQVSNLNSNTNYDFYVRAVCGENPEDDDSEWISLTEVETIVNYCNGDNFYDSGGANGNYRNNENKITVISPSDGTTFVEVEFLEFGMESCCDVLTIYDGPNISSPVLGTYSGTTLPGKFTSTHESGTLTFFFRSNGSFTGQGWEASVNCVTVTCPKPSSLEASNVTETSLTLNWNVGGDEEKWEVEYGESGFDIGTGTKNLTDTNTFEVTNLTSNTNYDFYVRAVCGETPNVDDSEWIGALNFTTKCVTSGVPFYEDFAQPSIPTCWFNIGAESWNFSTNAGFEAGNAKDNSPSGDTNYAWIDGSSPNGEEHSTSLFTNWIDISNLTAPALSFSLFSVNNLDLTYNTFKIVLLVGEDEQIIEIFNHQESTDGWKTFVIDFSEHNLTSNRIMVGFEVTENSPGNPAYNDILLDEVKIDEMQVLNTASNSITDFVYYPSPVQNELTIKASEPIEEVEIFNAIGQKVYRLKYSENANDVKVDMSSLSAGTYLIKVISDKKVNAFRIVKE